MSCRDRICQRLTCNSQLLGTDAHEGVAFSRLPHAQTITRTSSDPHSDKSISSLERVPASIPAHLLTQASEAQYPCHV